MILSKKGFYFYSSILLLLILNGPGHTSGTVSIDPTTACVGYPVTVSCTLYVPNSTDNFFSTLTNFIVGDSDAPILEATIDGTGAHGGVDLSKLMATATLGSTKSVMGTITLLSYTSGDNGIRLGCTNEYFINGNSNNRAMVTETLNISQAAPPLAPTITPSLSSLSPTDCTNTLISWPSPNSDRAIDRYYVFRDSSLLADIPASNTQYTDTDQLMVNTPYSYSVVANSCAGNSSAGVLSTISIPAHRLASISSVTYDNVSRSVDISWNLNTGTQSLLLAYSLTLVYNYTQSNVTYSFNDTVTISQSSDVTTLSVIISEDSKPSYITNDTVVLNITACVNITQQCGSSFGGQEVCGDSSTSFIPIITTPTTTLTQESSTITTSISNTTPPFKPSPSQDSPGVLIGIGVAVGSLLILSGIAIAAIGIAVVICACKKNEKDGNLHNDEGDQQDGIKMTHQPAELVYAELDLVASKTGGITQNIEDTHYMAVKPIMDGLNK